MATQTDKEKAAAEAAKKEAERKQRIRNEISKYQGKINDAKPVKADLESDKRTLDGYIQTFEGEQKKLSGKYLDVKKTDVFEGEMANNLATKISAVEQAISKGIGYAKKLSAELKTQIDELDSKIGYWEGQISSLRSQL